MSTPRPDTAFLFDVDNMLLDNDRVIDDLQSHLEHEVGAARAKCYWTLFEQLRTELGYADYLGALQRYRGEYPHDPDILTVSRFLLTYPFADRLFPHALEVIEHVKQWGPAALLTDGDVVFQPHKVLADYPAADISLDRLGDPAAASGRVILAHLGNGASLAAVRDGKSIDTSMGFTPTAGLPMGTRSGDLDPGLVGYLAHTEEMTATQFHDMVNEESGLLGVSEISSDMRDLLARETGDVRAAEAVALFCYQAKKWIGSFAATLGGLDTLVFAAGIGENVPLVRSRICEGLSFLGMELDESRNAENAAVISTDASRVTVRVIRTDEEQMIALSVCRILDPGMPGEKGNFAVD